LPLTGGTVMCSIGFDTFAQLTETDICTSQECHV